MNIRGVIIDDVYEYENNSNLIVELIKKFYSDKEIIFEKPATIDLYKIQIGSNIMMTIMPGDTWKEIKKNIDSKLYNLNKSDNICRLCGLGMEVKTECNKCKKSCCVECYINCFKKNEGIIKCDNCSFSYGQKIHKSYIDKSINNIRENACKMNKK